MLGHLLVRVLCCCEQRLSRVLTGLAILSLLGLAMETEPVSAAKRIAFVVGISKYDNLGDDKQLDNPVLDAQAIARKLGKLGFDVTTGMNLTRSQFNAKWQDVLDKTTSEDTLPFFYSGHGVEVDRQNFLLPRDIPYFKSSRHTQLKRESISVAELLADLRTGDREAPKITVMILDACRDDPTLSAEYKKGLGVQGGLAKIPTPQGTFIMYAAAPGKVSLDRLGAKDIIKNSVYTRTLLPLLGNPRLSIQDLAIKVRQQVYELTKSVAYEQIPEYTDGIIGRFCLAGCQAKEPLGSTESERQKLEEERRVLKTERERLEKERRLAEEQARLEAKRQKLAAERQRLAEEQARREEVIQTSRVPP